MSRSPLRSTAVLVSGAALFLAAGCGVEASNETANVNNGSAIDMTVPDSPVGGGDRTGGMVLLHKAAKATNEAETQKLSMTLDIEAGGQSMSTTIDAQSDVASNRSSATIDMSDMYEAIAAKTGVDMPSSAGVIDVVVDGDVTYVRSPMLLELSGADSSKPWMKMPTEESSENQVPQGQESAKAILDFLQKVGDEVIQVGTEDIRGVRTTHIRTNLDVKKMLAEADPSERAEMEEDLKVFQAGGSSKIATDVWVDDDSMVRKLVMKLDGAGSAVAGGASDASMTITIEMYDFGEPVDIEVPSASQINPVTPSMGD